MEICVGLFLFDKEFRVKNPPKNMLISYLFIEKWEEIDNEIEKDEMDCYFVYEYGMYKRVFYGDYEINLELGLSSLRI